MEKDKDENVPPAEGQKSRIPGYLSPFGIFSGMRAMLSPNVKPEPATSPLSTQNVDSSTPSSARSVLKDVNVMETSGFKGSATKFQGGGAQAEDLETASGPNLKSPEGVLKKSFTADRASLASESSYGSAASSFVSSVSVVNTSLPDLLLPEAAYRCAIESDTDTSTTYESAGENEGNVSAIEDQSLSFSETFSVDPSAVSSPLYEAVALDTTIVLESNSEAATTVVNGRTLVTENRDAGHSVLYHLPDSADKDANVSVSDLIEHLSGLSLVTPLKAPSKRVGINCLETADSLDGSVTQKGHVTLDSDISADQLDIIESDPSLDDLKLNNTIEVLCDKEVAEGLDCSKDSDSICIINETVDLGSDEDWRDTANNPYLIVNAVNNEEALKHVINSPSEDSCVNEELQSPSQTNQSCQNNIGSLGSISNISDLSTCSLSSTASEITETELRLLEALNSPYFVPSSLDSSESSPSVADLRELPTEPKLLEDIHSSSLRSIELGGSVTPCDVEISSQSDHYSSSESVFTVESDGDVTVVSLDLSATEAHSRESLLTDEGSIVTSIDIKSKIDKEEVVKESIEISSIETFSITESEVSSNGSNGKSCSQFVVPAVIVGKATEEEVDKQGVDAVNKLIKEKVDTSSSSTVGILDKHSIATNFDDVPVSVKTPRTFEEILAAELASFDCSPASIVPSSSVVTLPNDVSSVKTDEGNIKNSVENSKSSVCVTEEELAKAEGGTEVSISETLTTTKPREEFTNGKDTEQDPVVAKISSGILAADQGSVDEPSALPVCTSVPIEEPCIQIRVLPVIVPENVPQEEITKPGSVNEAKREINASISASSTLGLSETNFDEAPLPVKTRTFEEILAAELASEGCSPASIVPPSSKVVLPKDVSPVTTVKGSFRTSGESTKDISAESEGIAEVSISETSPTTRPNEELTNRKGTEQDPVVSKISSDILAADQGSVDEPSALPVSTSAPIEDSCFQIGVSPVIVPDNISQEEIKEPGSVNEVKGEIDSSSSAHSTVGLNLSNFDEAPLPVKTPRTFEEILAAELASEGYSPASIVPPSSEVILPNGVSPAKADSSCEQVPEDGASSLKIISTFESSAAAENLTKTINDILALDSTTLEAECEPLIENEESCKHKHSQNKADDSLESLMEKCKLQEMELKDISGNPSSFECLAAEASKLSLSLNTSSSIDCAEQSSVSPQESLDQTFDQTVIMANNHTDDNCNPFTSKPKVTSSPPVQRRAPDVELDNSLPGRGMGVLEKIQGNFGSIVDLESEEFVSGDVFKDPAALDFLSLHGGTTNLRDLRKESLYVKFDPLVGALTSSSDQLLPLPNMQPTQPENSLHNENAEATDTSAACQSTQENVPQDDSSSVSGKLISFSPASSKKTQDSSDRNSHQKPTPSKSTPVKTSAHIMLNETLTDFGSRGTIVTQEDLIKKLQEHQSVLAEQDEAYQERIADLNKQLQEKVQSLGDLKLIMKEYEKTISRLVAEKNQEKVTYEEQQEILIKERDQAQQHLNNMEIAFSDIHTKYERLKTVVEAFKKNEESLNTALSERQVDLEKMEKMYDMLKSHAVSKLEKANQDLEGIKQKHQQEAAKLKAMVKKLEIKTKSLEESLQQKTKENQALTTICDELINKVGE